jgi:subtilisin-like proprotein convertase family protein
VCLGDPIGTFDYVVYPNLDIPSSPGDVNSTIAVPDAFFVADVNVGIGISHTWVSDLIIEIFVPSGASLVLWNQACGSTDNINATADDTGTETFCPVIAAGPIDSVFFPPELAGGGPLTVFQGEMATGTWTLNVADNWSADTGTLNQWSLHFIGAGPACPTFDCPTDTGSGSACLDCQPGANGKVTICHFPPGNSAARHTIEVSAAALPAHCMNHGDTCGPCDEGEAAMADDMEVAVGGSSSLGQNRTNNAPQHTPRAQVRR